MFRTKHIGFLIFALCLCGISFAENVNELPTCIYESKVTNTSCQPDDDLNNHVIIIDSHSEDYLIEFSSNTTTSPSENMTWFVLVHPNISNSVDTILYFVIDEIDVSTRNFFSIEQGTYNDGNVTWNDVTVSDTAVVQSHYARVTLIMEGKNGNETMLRMRVKTLVSSVWQSTPERNAIMLFENPIIREPACYCAYTEIFDVSLQLGSPYSNRIVISLEYLSLFYHDSLILMEPTTYNGLEYKTRRVWAGKNTWSRYNYETKFSRARLQLSAISVGISFRIAFWPIGCKDDEACASCPNGYSICSLCKDGWQAVNGLCIKDAEMEGLTFKQIDTLYKQYMLSIPDNTTSSINRFRWSVSTVDYLAGRKELYLYLDEIRPIGNTVGYVDIYTPSTNNQGNKYFTRTISIPVYGERKPSNVAEIIKHREILIELRDIEPNATMHIVLVPNTCRYEEIGPSENQKYYLGPIFQSITDRSCVTIAQHPLANCGSPTGSCDISLEIFNFVESAITVTNDEGDEEKLVAVFRDSATAWPRRGIYRSSVNRITVESNLYDSTSHGPEINSVGLEIPLSQDSCLGPFHFDLYSKGNREFRMNNIRTYMRRPCILVEMQTNWMPVSETKKKPVVCWDVEYNINEYTCLWIYEGNDTSLVSQPLLSQECFYMDSTSDCQELHSDTIRKNDYEYQQILIREEPHYYDISHSNQRRDTLTITAGDEYYDRWTSPYSSYGSLEPWLIALIGMTVCIFIGCILAVAYKTQRKRCSPQRAAPAEIRMERQSTGRQEDDNGSVLHDDPLPYLSSPPPYHIALSCAKPPSYNLAFESDLPGVHSN